MVQEEIEDELDQKREEVMQNVEGVMNDKGKEWAERLKKQGNKKGKEDMYEELDKNLNRIEEQLAGDKARQDQLLKERLKQRRGRRAKLLEKLNVVEDVIADKSKDINQEKEVVNEEYKEDLDQEFNQLEKENDDKIRAVDDNLAMLRRERLSEYEDKLRAAANSNDFQSTLDAYQLSQAKVDKEMEKQRQL